MKSFHSKVLIILGVFVLLTATLLVLRTGILNTPKHIKGIEEIGVSFENLKIPEGVAEFQEVKLQMLQKLVNEGSCHAIAFEMSPAEAAMYNDAIRENETNLTELIGGTDYPLYDTKQMVDLLTWMREYNMSHDEAESVMIYGVDMQTGIRAAEYLRDFGQKHPEYMLDQLRSKSHIRAVEGSGNHGT